MTTEGATMYSSALLSAATPTPAVDAAQTPVTSHPQPATTSRPQPVPQPTVATTDAATVAAAAAAAATAAVVTQAAQQGEAKLQASPPQQPPSATAVPTVAHAASPAAMQPISAAAAAAAFGQYPTGMMFAPPDTAVMEDQPTYVNPKQYARILKRRESRKKQTGTDVTSYTPRKRSYMHESRHKHAMQRRRGPGGRFLSKEERQQAKESVAAGQ